MASYVNECLRMAGAGRGNDSVDAAILAGRAVGDTACHPSAMLSGMKLFLWFALGVLLFWWLRRGRRPEALRRQPPERPVERMVHCAQCGVNHPVGESVAVDGRYFCCKAHRQAASTARADSGQE